MESIQPDSQILVEIVTKRMPYGKYKNILICDLPVHYLEWVSRTGFPAGRLGMLLSTIYEIKLNGLTAIITQVKSRLNN